MQKTEKQKKSKFKTFGKVILMVAIFGGLIFAVMGLGDINDLTDRLTNMDTKFLLITIALTILYFIFMILPHFFIAIFQKTKVDKTRIFLNASNEYFFNAITPAQGGSQPVQSYIYIKHGATGDEASSILTSAYINYQFVANILSTITLVILVAFHKDVLQGRIAIVIIGFALNFGVLLLIIFLTFSKKFPKFVQKLLYLFAKLKPFKEKLTKVADDTPQIVRKFQKSTREMMKKKRFLIFTTVIRIIALIIYYSIPYFVAKALRVDVTTNDFIFIMSISLVATTLMAWFPLPGSSGGVEAIFVLLFVSVPTINQNAAMSILFVWRLFTFYFGMIWGIGAYGIMKIIDFQKAKRAKVFHNKIYNNESGKLKVALLCDSYHDNDDAKEIYQELLNEGHQPYVLTHTISSENPKNTIYLKTTRLRMFNKFKANSLFYLNSNYKKYKSENFDAVHAINSIFHLKLLIRIRKNEVTPLFVTETVFSNEYGTQNLLRKKCLYYRLEKLLHLADRVLPRNIDNTLFYQVNKFKPSYIIDPSLLDEKEIFNIKLIEENKTFEKSFKYRYLLLFTNFGLDRFIDFYFGVKENHELFKDTQFIIVGNVNLTKGLKNSLIKNNLTNNFIFIDDISNHNNILTEIDGYVKEEFSPSNSLFYIIALANSKPVLLPENIKLPQDFKSSDNIYLYSYFGNFMEQITNIKNNGYQQSNMLENYYNQSIGKRLAKIYLEIAKEK